MSNTDASVINNGAVGPFQAGRVFSVAVCHLIHDIYSSFLFPLLPLLIEKLGITLAAAGALSTIMQLPALLNPILGSLADRFSIRYFVITAPVLTAVPMSLLGLAPKYAIVVFILVLAGISTHLFHVPAPVLVARLSGSKVGQGMSWFMTGGEIARTLAPLTAVGAVSLFGLEGMWPVMIVGILASVWLYLRLKDLPEEPRPVKRTPITEAWRRMQRLMIPLAAILALQAMVHACMVTFLPTFIEQQTGSLTLAGTGLSLLEACGVAGVFLSGSLSDRIGRRKILAVQVILGPIALAAFVLGPTWLRIAALAITGISLLSTTPVLLAMVQEHAGDIPAAANGFFMMAIFLARALATIPVGFMGDMFGLSTSFLIAACFGSLSLPLIWALPKRPS
jgi:FSR family fosmidomycin resistance protein-like MFS transporter